MQIISALFIGRIADAACAEGLSRRKLLESCGVDAEAPIDPAQMIGAEAHYALWEHILTALDSSGFPIRYARTIRADDYGAFGLATKTAPTLLDSLHRANRYLKVLTNTSWLELREHETSAELIFRREGARRLGMRCANEAAIGEIIGHMREISGVNLTPLQVTFRHPAPTDTTEHQHFFGCPVLFDQELDSLEIAPSVAKLPLPKADDGLSRFVTAHLDAVVSKPGHAKSIEESLKASISNALPDGPPDMDAVAKGVGMSRRTLARRLAELDTNFQALVEDTRRQAAKQLLTRTPHSLGEISFLLGFSEQSSFQRAFKRWTGATPAEFRQSAA